VNLPNNNPAQACEAWHWRGMHLVQTILSFTVTFSSVFFANLRTVTDASMQRVSVARTLTCTLTCTLTLQYHKNQIQEMQRNPVATRPRRKTVTRNSAVWGLGNSPTPQKAEFRRYAFTHNRATNMRLDILHDCLEKSAGFCSTLT
jgi:hypothetical protein